MSKSFRDLKLEIIARETKLSKERETPYRDVDARRTFNRVLKAHLKAKSMNEDDEHKQYRRQRCLNHGTWGGTIMNPDDDSATCDCDSGYIGDDCEHQIAGCSDLGVQKFKDDGTFECECNEGYSGDRCQYSDAETCSGNGIAQGDGSCKCNTPFYEIEPEPIAIRSGKCTKRCIITKHEETNVDPTHIRSTEFDWMEMAMSLSDQKGVEFADRIMMRCPYREFNSERTELTLHIKYESPSFQDYGRLSKLEHLASMFYRKADLNPKEMYELKYRALGEQKTLKVTFVRKVGLDRFVFKLWDSDNPTFPEIPLKVFELNDKVEFFTDDDIKDGTIVGLSDDGTYSIRRTDHVVVKNITTDLIRAKPFLHKQMKKRREIQIHNTGEWSPSTNTEYYITATINFGYLGVRTINSETAIITYNPELTKWEWKRGDFDKILHGSMKRKPRAEISVPIWICPVPSLEIGTEVDFNYPGERRRYSAKINSTNDDGTFNVVLDADCPPCRSKGKYDGSCVCNEGFNGPRCEFSDESCPGEGTMSMTGTCEE